MFYFAFTQTESNAELRPARPIHLSRLHQDFATDFLDDASRSAFLLLAGGLRR